MNRVLQLIDWYFQTVMMRTVRLPDHFWAIRRKRHFRCDPALLLDLDCNLGWPFNSVGEWSAPTRRHFRLCRRSSGISLTRFQSVRVEAHLAVRRTALQKARGRSG